ncbi:hypothetical protein M1N16_04000 [Nitrospinaceae bacterium]|nr:hypothetical protein [Nitrospinaceae bacterium]
MKKLNLFLMLVMIGLGMMVLPSPAQSSPAVTSAPCEAQINSSKSADGGNCANGPGWNARIAIAPYAQVVANDSYTFIGVSHPSLATAHTSIGVVIEALDMVTVPNTAAGRAAVFTVSAGETHRVFIVNQSHSTINANNAAFTDTQTHLITTTDGNQFGNIKAWSIGTSPNFSTTAADRPGTYIADDELYRHDNLNQLSMWGVVYQSANGAGFALEFVGDMHDSNVSGITTPLEATGHTIVVTDNAGVGRGVN